MDELNHLGWVVKRSYDLAGVVFGIRTNSAPAGEWLDELLGRYRIDDDEAEPNYSLYISESGKLGKRFHVLYRDSSAVARTFDATLLARVLAAEIESLTFRARADAVYLGVGLVTAQGVTALVGAELVPALEETWRRSGLSAFSIPMAAATGVDLKTGDVVPVPRPLRLSERALHRLAERVPSSADGRRWIIHDRRLAVDVVCSTGPLGTEPARPVSRGAGLYKLAARAVNLHEVEGLGLDALARLVRRAQCYELAPDRSQRMIDRLAAVLAGIGAGRRVEGGTVTA